MKAASQVDEITFRDLYELYPDFNINIKAEQSMLLAHDIIIWQHPFYWYSCPPLMKKWIDLVLEYGWAYGANGDQLKGKSFLNAITSAGNFEAYKYDTKISKTGEIKLPLNIKLFDKEVEIIIVPKQETKLSSKPSTSDFLNKWSGFLLKGDSDKSKYQYLTD